MSDRQKLPNHPADDDPGVAAWSALLRVHAEVVRTIGDELEAKTGLPLSWYDVLLELNAAEGRRLRMSDLSERVVLSRTRVSRLVDDLVAAGLVTKAPDPDDGRATLAVLTHQGRARLRKAAPVYLAGIRQHFSDGLDEGQLGAVRDTLEAVLAREGGSMIRTYEPADEDAVIAVWLASTIPGQSFLAEDVWRRMEPDIRSLLPNAEAWVSEEDGTIVAFAAVHADLLGGLFTHPDHQGQGHGARLVQRCKAGRDTLDVEVFVANTRARAFYERVGFRPHREYLDEDTGLPMLVLRMTGRPKPS